VFIILRGISNSKSYFFFVKNFVHLYLNTMRKTVIRIVLVFFGCLQLNVESRPVYGRPHKSIREEMREAGVQLTDDAVAHIRTGTSKPGGAELLRLPVWGIRRSEPDDAEIELQTKYYDDEENEDGVEDKRIENNIHSHIEAIKEEVEREYAEEEMRRGSANREVKWKSPPRTDTYADEEKRIKNNIHSHIEAIKEKVEREKAEEEMRRGSENREVKWKSPPRTDTYAGEERSIENNIHSHIEAIKEKVEREKAKEEMRRGSENREVKWKSPPRTDTYADEERRIENNIHSHIEAY
jgi:uncharacterized protein (UPF0218 family)